MSLSGSQFDNSSTYLGKRKRKNNRQVGVLKKELKLKPLWSRADIDVLADRLQMSATQIYKWWWDQTRKRIKRRKDSNHTVKQPL
jgi:hypothetical protein